MKTRSIYLFASLIATFALFATPKTNAQQANISATLILASVQETGMDPALKAYESNLKRIFKYKSYKLQGKSATKISLPGESIINLGSGHKLSLNAAASSGGKIRLSVRWSDGRRTLINTTINMSKGVPTLLGGPSAPSQNGNLILALVAR
jgi:hypothetical protein